MSLSCRGVFSARALYRFARMTNNRERGDATIGPVERPNAQAADPESLENRAVIDPTGQYTSDENDTPVYATAYDKPIPGSKLTASKPTGATALLVAAGLAGLGYFLFFANKKKKGRKRR